jgi:hypothetical protein
VLGGVGFIGQAARHAGIGKSQFDERTNRSRSRMTALCLDRHGCCISIENSRSEIREVAVKRTFRGPLVMEQPTTAARAQESGHLTP